MQSDTSNSEGTKDVVDSYKLGDVEVVVSKSGRPGRLSVKCWDGHYRSSFEVSEYEFSYYRRHMNQKITIAYRRQHESDSEGAEGAEGSESAGGGI